jgi:hypothetical protein
MNTKNENKTVLLFAVMAVAMLAVSANAGVIDFGTMNTTGDDGDGAWQTCVGWTFSAGNTGDDAGDGSPDGRSWWVGGGGGWGLGTSDGDTVAAGDYSIDFLTNEPGGTQNILVEAFAWDGTTQTLLGSDDPAAVSSWDWQNLSFSVSSGSPLIGQQLQLKFSNTGTGYGGWDTISGDFTVGDPSRPEVDAGSDWVTWSGADVTVTDVNVVDHSDPVTALTYLWTADPVDGVVFDSNSIESPTITITKVTTNPSVVTLTLAVNNVGSSSPDVIDTMQIKVYDDSCEAAKGIGTAISFDPTDLNQDCITNLEDFAEVAAAWLDNYTLTGPTAK